MHAEVLEWYSYALDALRRARRNLRARRFPSPAGASIDSQQAAEMALKALIRHQGLRVRKVHDLVLLLNSLEQAPPELLLMKQDLQLLFLSAGAARYPGGEHDPADARRDVEVARRVVEIVSRALGLPEVEC